MASFPGTSGRSGAGGGNHPSPNEPSEMEIMDSPPNNPESIQDTLYSCQPGSISSVSNLQTGDLKCVVCKEYPMGEIQQCSNGHIVCNECIERLTLCPICSETYIRKIRNRPVEAVLDTMTFNCNFRNYGCLMTQIPRDQRNAHEIQCVYNPSPSGINFCGLFNSSRACQFRICPKSMKKDPQHCKDVIEHLTRDPHNLPHHKIKIGDKISNRFRLPTSLNDPPFAPVQLFEVYKGTTRKTIIGYYVLVLQVAMPWLQQLSWTVVGFKSAPEDPNGGNSRNRRITVKFAIKPNTDPDNVARNGDGCVSNQSWTIKSTHLNEWENFIMMPSDRRPPCGFSLPVMFLSDYYVQEDGMCEMSVGFGPLAD